MELMNLVVDKRRIFVYKKETVLFYFLNKGVNHCLEYIMYLDLMNVNWKEYDSYFQGPKDCFS